MKYRPEIDGLRALAVVPVILFHAGVAPFSGGYVGVDIFFVISGYLITTIIFQARRAGRFSLVDFYERRARRILPALLLVIAACVPFAMLWMLPNQREDFFQSVVAVNLFGSNGLFWLESGYFDVAAELKPLLHTWSLAVEEQFYVVFPLILMATVAPGGRAPFRLVLGLTVLSFVACVIGARTAPGATFFLLPFRAWELGAGALAAFALADREAPWRNGIIAAAGLAALCVSIFAFRPDTLFPSEFALLPVAGTVAIILAAHPRTITGRLLAWRPLVWVGLVSYSAYLWHQPLFAFARIRLGELHAPQIALLIGLTFALAWASWRFVERPVRMAGRHGRGVFAGRGRILGLSGGAIAAFLALGVFGVAKDGFRGDWDAQNVGGYTWDNKALQQASWQLLWDGSYEGHVGDPADDRPGFVQPGLPGLLVVGNSLSKSMFNQLHFYDGLSERTEIRRYGVEVKDIAADHPFFASPNYRDAEAILIASRYDAEDLAQLPDILSRMQADGKVVAVATRGPEFFGDGIRTRVDFAVQGMLLRKEEIDIPALVDRMEALHWQDATSVEFSHIARINADLVRILENADVIGLDLLEAVCVPREERCLALGPGLSKYYFDSMHITFEGAAAVGARMARIGWLDPLLEAMPDAGP